MPIRLNVGVSRKLGLPDYGSAGASCNVEVELEGSLLQSDPEGFQRHVRHAFTACRQAVDDQLASQQTSRQTSANGHSRAERNGHASSHRNGNGRSNGRRATASQVRAIEAIAGRQQLDLAAELRRRYGTDRAEDLSITEASELIDALKAAAGPGERR